MGAVSPGTDWVPLGANHPKTVKIGPFTLLLVSEMGWWLCPRELEPLLPPQRPLWLAAGRGGKPGGSYCAWCVIKNTGNLTIKPARFPALIPDQRGFGKEHPRFECLSQPGPVSF